MIDPRNERRELYTEADWQSYMLPYYEELIEEQRRRERRDRMWNRAAVALAVIDCLLIIAYCVVMIVF